MRMKSCSDETNHDDVAERSGSQNHIMFSLFKSALLLIDKRIQRVICSLPKIMELFGNTKCRYANRNSLCDVNYTISGCCIIVRGKCLAGHIFHWQSSDTVANQTHATMFVNTLHFSTAAVLSGNNYHKIKMFPDIFSLCISCSNAFHACQQHYICPGVNDFTGM